MKLYILRHAIAVDREEARAMDDSQRPLTAEGKRKLKSVVRGIKRMGLSFDVILSSPYLRALQTAEIAARGLGQQRRLELDDALKPEGSFRELIEHLQKRKAATVMLVGHEPFLSGLISFLVSGRPNLAITMKKAGLCFLTIESLKYGRCATLEWLLTPKQMALMR